MKLLLKKSSLFFTFLLMCMILPVFQAFSQLYNMRIVSYNEVSTSGEERIINAMVWFKEVPVIPVYVYDDPDLERKVYIRTKISPYKGGAFYSFSNFDIVAGKYGEVLTKCTETDTTFILQNIQELQTENIGESLAFELDVNVEKKILTLVTYIFESEFPFKFPEDVVIKTFDIREFETKCRSRDNP